ncbi:hypothetical protein GCM10011492_06720 [Flexivirga endophytica]|uniref:N-acetyltransferase domain-containing protein n=1 Tax=Flexivirga endophytica TaxID=1849103 RepID=A0A916SW26_9MICO|nr:GNAT family N-acetyltransferase [Flexivirga endophytica]GGB19532.1 hypothetical protein GCM10011492_06720 [Flexivirga endophytica]GHB36163.1 hypothetical protein GCM10008112_00890 [Flexivirga endophytica]
MPRLAWAKATAQDKPELTSFVCTAPAKAAYNHHRKMKHHPTPWELEVQSSVKRMKVAKPDTEALLIGRDGRGIAAVSNFSLAADRRGFCVCAIAVAKRVQRRGIGKEALLVSLDWMRTMAGGRSTEMAVMARIDPRNDASRKCFAHCGFEYHRMDGAFEVWVRELVPVRVSHLQPSS